MGLLRLYLAACVVAAHSERLLPWSMHGGKEAVEFFFVLSGFYMQLVLASKKYEKTHLFYLSRAERIFLPYYACLLLCLIFSLFWWSLLGNGLTCHTVLREISLGTLNEAGNFPVLLTNLTVFFQDWVMFIDRDANGNLCVTEGVGRCNTEFYNLLIIPQAWSISVELQFYLLSPFLARKISTAWLTILALTIGLLRCAFLSYYEINFDPWNYRFAFFELFNFLVGMLACRVFWLTPSIRQKLELFASFFPVPGKISFYVIFLPLTLLFLRFLLGLHSNIVRLAIPHGDCAGIIANLALICVWAATLPFFFCLTRNREFDRFIGDLSYPIYLLHLTIATAILSVSQYIGISSSYTGEICFVATALASIGLNCSLLQFLENRRKRLSTNTNSS